jgi:cellulose synthase/poly-beta-1,6-N-acetylglucosamine synthase-like glycosyltransferase
MNTLLLASPWLVSILLVLLLFRRRRRVSDFPATVPRPPFVSIIVPARNEADNIAPCIGTLLNSDYEQREIIVVNDGSTDETGTIARALEERAPGELTVVDTTPLPEGWLGKNWACWTGYRLARGEILLFTDADTRHDDDLLGHAVGAWTATGAGLVTVLPRQLMQSFWERVALPHVFLSVHLRFLSLLQAKQPRNPRAAIANGQFLMLPRSVYEQIGGHEAVRGEVVEDMRLAQLAVAAGQLSSSRMRRTSWRRGCTRLCVESLKAGRKTSIEAPGCRFHREWAELRSAQVRSFTFCYGWCLHSCYRWAFSCRLWRRREPGRPWQRLRAWAAGCWFFSFCARKFFTRFSIRWARSSSLTCCCAAVYAAIASTGAGASTGSRGSNVLYRFAGRAGWHGCHHSAPR